MRHFFTISLVISGCTFLQGCMPAAIMGGTAMVGTTLAEDRKIGQVFSDVELNRRVIAKWLAHDDKINEMVEVQVREGRVLLSGVVDSPLRQIDAVRLAWEVPGVKEIIDETKVGKEYSLASYAHDSWTTTKVKTELLFDEDIQSVNYNIKTVDGHVYLIGIAQNQDEIDRAVNKAKGVSGVKSVISHMRIKTEPRTDPYRSTPATTYAGNVREDLPIVEQPLSDTSSNMEFSYPNPRAR